LEPQLEDQPAGETGTPGQVGATDRKVHNFRREAARRSAGMSHVFSQIESAMRKIMATPLLEHDEHCQNLVARIARSGTMDDFSVRVAAFQSHVRRLAAQKAGSGASTDGRDPSQSSSMTRRFAAGSSDAGADGSGGPSGGRRRMRL